MNTKIAEVNNNLASSLDADAVANLTEELNDLEAQLNKIVDVETEGLIKGLDAVGLKRVREALNTFAIWRKE